MELATPSSTQSAATTDQQQSKEGISRRRNDNSNPQQGTGGATSAPMAGHSLANQSMTQTHHPHGRPSLKIPPTKKDSRKLFVGGLPADITDDEFKAFFSQFGELIDCIVMFDRDTHRSRGFGFVTFEDPEVSRKLLAMGNEGKEPSPGEKIVGRLEMRGKIIEVKAATPKESGAPYRRPSHFNNRRPHHEAPDSKPHAPTPHAEPYNMMYAPEYNYPYYNPYYPVSGYMVPPMQGTYPMAADVAVPQADGYGPPLGAPQTASAPFYPVAASVYPYAAAATTSTVPMMGGPMPMMALAAPPQAVVGSSTTPSVMQPVAPGVPDINNNNKKPQGEEQQEFQESSNSTGP